MDTLLLVDDDVSLLESLTLHFEDAERDGQPRFQVVTATTAAAGLQKARESAPSLVVLDMMLPDRSGLDLIEEMKSVCGDAPIVPGHRVPRHGEHHPRDEARGLRLHPQALLRSRALDLVINRALTVRPAQPPRGERGARHHARQLGDLVGQTPVMQQLVKEIGKVAAAPRATVLVTGESGTGKELVARVIHNYSFDDPRPFVGINCSAIVETLLEIRALRARARRVHRRRHQQARQVRGGRRRDRLLDEIGDLSPQLQAKLLRVLQEREFERVGGTKRLTLQARVIAATHRDLAEEVKSGRFREDLYQRLRVIALHVPPLRERREDIPLLVKGPPGANQRPGPQAGD
jgi:two-component system response regulator AtoC